MLRRYRSPSCFPSIACFSIAADKVLIEEEERGEEGEGRGEEAGEEKAREVGSCAKHRHAKQKGRKCWFYSQCRKIALDLAFLVIPTIRTNAATRALRFSFSRRERRGLSHSHRSWLLESDFQVASCDVQKVSESEDDHPASSRINFSSDVDSISTTVLLLNLEKDEEGSEVVAASSSPPRKERSFLVFGFGWLRRQQPLERAISPVSKALVRFSFPELRAATDGFPQGGMLGKGALSSVFRGKVRWLSVAVKRLEGPEKECAKAFYRELTIAGSLSNANVVPLVGYCVDRNGLFLVYKYVSGGSLDHHLYREGDGEANSAAGVGLSWRQRFKVALGTARAVEYLHFGTDKCIIHRDIKPSNILLSSNNTPKLCDFGLATWAEETSLPFLCKTVKGTFGYLAPEYFQHGKLSDKTDVYAFGVLLLELISGRKAIDTTRPQGDENLVVWARPLLQKGEGALKDLMDPRLTGSYSQVEVTRMVLAAATCLDVDDLSRPTIKEAVKILCGSDGSNDGCAKLSGSCYLWEEMRTDSDMTSHLALAMLGVSDSEDEAVYDH